MSKISKFDVKVDHPNVDTSAQIRCGYVSAGKVRIRQQRQGKDTILQRYSTDTHVDWNKASARQLSVTENTGQPRQQNENWQAGKQGRGFLANSRQAARQETGQFEIQTSNMFADFC